MNIKLIKVGKIIKVVPEDWRKTTSFLGKVREVTQSGAYVSRMKGKKYATISCVYYGVQELQEYYPHAFGCEKFDDGKCNCGYESLK